MVLPLAELVESESSIRNRMRDPVEGGCITRWPRPELVGVPSVKSMALNVVALEAIARWWTINSPTPSVVPIDEMRTQARIWSKKCKFSEPEVAFSFNHKRLQFQTPKYKLQNKIQKSTPNTTVSVS